MGPGRNGTGEAFFPVLHCRLRSPGGVCHTNATAYVAGTFSLRCLGRGGHGRGGTLTSHTHSGIGAAHSVWGQLGGTGTRCRDWNMVQGWLARTRTWCQDWDVVRSRFSGTGTHPGRRCPALGGHLGSKPTEDGGISPVSSPLKHTPQKCHLELDTKVKLPHVHRFTRFYPVRNTCPSPAGRASGFLMQTDLLGNGATRAEENH